MRIVSRGLRAFSRLLLHPVECRLADTSDRPLHYAPIFIIGAPRSGSTLLYQVMAEYYKVGYLTNLHCRFFGAPSWVERVVRPERWRKASDFTSTHGQTDHFADPSECGDFWYRFFRRRPQYVPLAEADPRKMRQLRGAIRALGDASGRPLLFKNLYCTLRLGPIMHALPESLFIVIHRDLVDNAHSLLEGRMKTKGDYSLWWSAEPPMSEELITLPAHEQVVEQVLRIYRVVEQDKAAWGSERFFSVQYEELCADVLGVLSAIDQFLTSHDVHLDVRNPRIPPSFQARAEVRIDAHLYEMLVEYARARASAEGA